LIYIASKGYCERLELMEEISASASGPQQEQEDKVKEEVQSRK
jgi:hypothetical protein